MTPEAHDGKPCAALAGMSSREWGIVALAAATVFIATALLAWVTGISGPERRVFQAIESTFDRHSAFFHWCTALGRGQVVLIAGLFFLVLLPGPSLRRWWLWIAVVVAVSALEASGKSLIGRPRPETIRAGFPSGHTALAAAFYPMVAYVAGHWMRRRAVRAWTYGAAAAVVLMVGVSRLVLRQHWPLDVVGGAALGIAVFAAAASWYERFPARPGIGPTPFGAILGRWIHRHGAIIPVPFFALLFVNPAMGQGHARLDVLFDAAGAVCIAAALWLHLWAAQHPAPHHGARPALSTGPYVHMRHPRQVVYVLVAVGIAALAESELGLVLIPAVLIAVYRVVAHVENVDLARRCGAAYAARCAEVPLMPWPTPELFRAAAGATPWRALPQERRFVVATLLLAVLADLSELLPRLF